MPRQGWPAPLLLDGCGSLIESAGLAALQKRRLEGSRPSDRFALGRVREERPVPAAGRMLQGIDELSDLETALGQQ